MAEPEFKRRHRYNIWTTDTIRYSDLDPNHHVNNGAIGAYFEDGRVRFREDHLANAKGALIAGFVIARYLIEYHAPLHFPGSVDIGTTVLRVGRSSYTLAQAVFRDDTCIATAEVVNVRLDPESGQTVPLGETLTAILNGLAQPTQSA